MSDVSIGRAHVDITSRTEGLDRGLRTAEQRTRAAARRIDRETRGIERSFANVGAALSRSLAGPLAALSGGVLLRGLVRAADQALTVADNIGKTADRVGLSVETFQELSFAATQSGVTAESFANSMQRLARRVAEARDGTGEMAAIAEEFGISLASPEAALNDLAELMRRTPDQADRVRIAFNAFGREGVGMVNMLRDGSASMDELRRRARELGVVFETSAVRRAEELRSEMDALTQALGTRFREALLEIGPLLVQTARLALGLARAVGTVYDAVVPDAVTRDPGVVARQLERERESVRRFSASAAFTTDDAARRDLERRIAESEARIGELRALERQLLGAAVAGPGSPGVPTLGQVFDDTGDVPGLFGDRSAAATAERQGEQFADMLERLAAGGREAQAAWREAQIAAEIDALNDAQARGAAITERYATENERLFGELLDLSEAYRAGTIGTDTYNRGLATLRDQIARTDPAVASLASGVRELGRVAVFEFDRMGEAATRYLDRLLDLVALQPLERGIASLLSGVLPGASAGPSAGELALVGQARIAAGVAHRGGIVGRTALPTRSVPAAAFARAPRLQSGYLGNNEFAAILHRNEVVLNERQQAALAGAVGARPPGVEVHIHTPPGTQARQEQRDRGGGGRRLDVVIDDMMARTLADPASASRRTLQTVFGLSNALTSR